MASLLARSHFHLRGAAGTESRRLMPGAPERSAVLVRMRTRQPVEQMPPVATRVVDAEATRRIERWIEELPSGPTP
jgi:hypothetical protein